MSGEQELILASCSSPVRRNSVFEVLRVKMLIDSQEEQLAEHSGGE